MALAPGIIQVQPVLTGSGAYSSGQCVGPPQKLSVPGAGRTQIKLQSVSVSDEDNQKAALTVLLFSDDPVGQGGATCTDQAAFAWGSGSASQLFVGKVDIAAADYESNGSTPMAVASKANLQLVLNAAARAGVDPALYAVILTTGTPTYASADSLTLSFGFDAVTVK